MPVTLVADINRSDADVMPPTAIFRAGINGMCIIVTLASGIAFNYLVTHDR